MNILVTYPAHFWPDYDNLIAPIVVNNQGNRVESGYFDHLRDLTFSFPSKELAEVAIEQILAIHYVKAELYYGNQRSEKTD